MESIITIELYILVIMIFAKSIILRRNGISALRFKKPDKSALALIFIIGCCIYAGLAGAWGLPLPAMAGKLFWNIKVLNMLAVLICTLSLIWFGVTLIIFGNSFRIGIDEKTNDELITTGTFAISRNPVFIAFIAFFLGVFLACSNMITLIFLILLMIMVHLQILKEEKFLKNHYGEKYANYCAKVRRYI